MSITMNTESKIYLQLVFQRENRKFQTPAFYDISKLVWQHQHTHVYLLTSSKLAPLSMSKAASSTCPPQAARVRGDSKESAGMLTCAPLSNSSRATSTWPSWDSETHRECRDKHIHMYIRWISNEVKIHSL